MNIQLRRVVLAAHRDEVRGVVRAAVGERDDVIENSISPGEGMASCRAAPAIERIHLVTNSQ